jgi:hypothetical protein
MLLSDTKNRGGTVKFVIILARFFSPLNRLVYGTQYNPSSKPFLEIRSLNIEQTTPRKQ